MKQFILVLLLSAGMLNAQNIYTIAGMGSAGSGGDNGHAINAQLDFQEARITIDLQGNMLIPDWSNHRVRRVDMTTGIITTIAGTGASGYNGDGIPATSAQLYSPSSVAVDDSGNIYIGEYTNCRVRKINASTGLISTVAGTGVWGYNGDNIQAATAQLSSVTSIAFDTSGSLIIADMSNQRIRKVNLTNGVITTIAGTGNQGYNGDNIAATSADLYMPFGLAVDVNNNIYFADRLNYRVRKIENATGLIHTVAGDGTPGTGADGSLATSVPVNEPFCVAVDNNSNIYIAECNANKIRKVDNAGIITTVAGTGSFGYSGDGGPATSANLAYPRGVTVDDCGHLYISDRNNSRIRRVATFSTAISYTSKLCYGACSGTAGVTASGGNAPYSYTWSGGVSSGSSVSGLCAGTHQLTVTDSAGCKEYRSFEMTELYPINAIVTTTNANCLGNGSASCTVTGGTGPGTYTYQWSNGDTGTTMDSASAGTYFLIITDTINCAVTQTVSIANSSAPYNSAPICMVTVDSTSTHNIVMWDKTPYTNIDSFIIYREITTNNYQRIAALHSSALSQFIDTVHTLYFPNTGNPNIGTYRYKIQMLDTCGTYSQMSPYHNTIYITCNNGTFTWPQLYTIEGGANPVSSYVLQRDDLSTGNWQTIGSVAGTQQSITDPMYSTFQATATWRVQTQWSISCAPTYKIQQNTISSINSSVSNKFSNLTTAVAHSNNNERIQLYPTPNNGTFFIETPDKAKLTVYSSMGQTVTTTEIEPGRNQLNFNTLAAGTYIIKLVSHAGVATKRIIIE